MKTRQQRQTKRQAEVIVGVQKKRNEENYDRKLSMGRLNEKQGIADLRVGKQRGRVEALRKIRQIIQGEAQMNVIQVRNHKQRDRNRRKGNNTKIISTIKFILSNRTLHRRHLRISQKGHGRKLQQKRGYSNEGEALQMYNLASKLTWLGKASMTRINNDRTWRKMKGSPSSQERERTLHNKDMKEKAEERERTNERESPAIKSLKHKLKMNKKDSQIGRAKRTPRVVMFPRFAHLGVEGQQCSKRRGKPRYMQCRDMPRGVAEASRAKMTCTRRNLGNNENAPPPKP
ncbi:hypothetical protein EV421DRAFT_1743781 [Armillaria borealis]|uniref:Uncharacterized protein n=1 Tax=Armillaria borealis TaxID=47425 RepID=A0AA39MDD0_9AGAR|nr:hypothetical protein EV421DRAFT_1743781 [Armillaria borealis]